MGVFKSLGDIIAVRRGGRVTGSDCAAAAGGWGPVARAGPVLLASRSAARDMGAAAMNRGGALSLQTRKTGKNSSSSFNFECSQRRCTQQYHFFSSSVCEAAAIASCALLSASTLSLACVVAMAAAALLQELRAANAYDKSGKCTPQAQPAPALAPPLSVRAHLHARKRTRSTTALAEGAMSERRAIGAGL